MENLRTEVKENQGHLGVDYYPRDPPVLKTLRRVNFGTGRAFGTDVAKGYGEGSEMLSFLGK